jgi:putative ABC transport system permease protein
MTLAMTAGALGVGLAALGSIGQAQRSQAIFPVWVAAVLLATCASLVMTTAALAALERRQELGLLGALGARPRRIRRLILLEYGIVAVGGGSLGALLALLAWWLSGLGHRWLLGLSVAVIDVVAAVVTAWLGAAPVLWLISRQPPGESLRDQPWLKL